MTTQATIGYGVKVKVGDGGVGDGTQASKTIGSSDQQLKILARQAGEAGNSKTFGITVSGTASYSQTITKNSVAIVSASSSGTATTTVAEAISALYLDETFVENFQATVGTGDGTGVLVAGSSGALSSGADGTEVFTSIAEIKNVGGPNLQAQVVDVTNSDSANRTREFITGLIDPGDLTFLMNFIPGNSGQQGLVTDMKNGTLRNFQLVWPDADLTVCSLSARIVGFSPTANQDNAMEANVSLKISGFPEWF